MRRTSMKCTGVWILCGCFHPVQRLVVDATTVDQPLHLSKIRVNQCTLLILFNLGQRVKTKGGGGWSSVKHQYEVIALSPNTFSTRVIKIKL